MIELKDLDLTSIIELHKDQKLTSEEIYRYYKNRVDQYEPKINALYGFDSIKTEKALQKNSRDKIHPLQIPIPIKELTEVLDQPTYYGSKAFEGNKSTYTRDAVQRLFDAGYYCFGRSKACEFGMLPYTISDLHGPSNNPWDLTRNPGGSSGGAAAIVSAGLAPVAHATDGGGSIRIPASWCGLVGFKPSRGRVPTGPKISFSYLSTAGVITRSVRDQKIFYDNYWTGKETNQWIPPLADSARLREKDSIKIGLLLNTPFSKQLHPIAIEHTKKFALAVAAKDANIQFDEMTIEFGDSDMYRDAFTNLWASMLNSLPSNKAFEKTTKYLIKHAENNSSLDLQRSINQLSIISKNILKQIQNFDFILTPTLPDSAPKNQTLAEETREGKELIDHGFEITPYTTWVNVIGLPALTMPHGFWDNGMPFGAQLISTKFEDRLLLDVGEAIEKKLGYADKNGVTKGCCPIAPGF